MRIGDLPPRPVLATCTRGALIHELHAPHQQDLSKAWLDKMDCSFPCIVKACLPSPSLRHDEAFSLSFIFSILQALGFKKTSEFLKHPQVAACVRSYTDPENNQMVAANQTCDLKMPHFVSEKRIHVAIVHGTSVLCTTLSRLQSHGSS